MRKINQLHWLDENEAVRNFMYKYKYYDKVLVEDYVGNLYWQLFSELLWMTLS